jgi:hypothetical protein
VGDANREITKSKMPAPYSEDLRWRVIWFVHILQHSISEASFYLGLSERTIERYLTKFLVTGDVKPDQIGRSFGSITFAPREELIIFEAVLSNPDKILVKLQTIFTGIRIPPSPYQLSIIFLKGAE